MLLRERDNALHKSLVYYYFYYYSFSLSFFLFVRYKGFSDMHTITYYGFPQISFIDIQYLFKINKFVPVCMKQNKIKI